MQFHNPQLADHDLPDVDEIEFRAVDARYPWIISAMTALILLIIIGGILGGLCFEGHLQHFSHIGWFALVLLLPLLGTWLAYAHAKSHRYAVREHDLLLRKGIFWRKEIAQPLIRLQHVELHRGPIDKAVGITKFKVFSAGSGRETFTIPGLPLRTAARMRRFVLAIQRD